MESTKEDFAVKIKEPYIIEPEYTSEARTYLQFHAMLTLADISKTHDHALTS